MTDDLARVRALLAEQKAADEVWEATTPGTPEWDKAKARYQSYDIVLQSYVGSLLTRIENAESRLSALQEAGEYFKAVRQPEHTAPTCAERLGPDEAVARDDDIGCALCRLNRALLDAEGR